MSLIQDEHLLRAPENFAKENLKEISDEENS